MIYDYIPNLPFNLITADRLANNKPRSPIYNTQVSGLVNLYRRYLMEEAASMYKVNGFPDSIRENIFIYDLLINGYVAVLDTPEYGIIARPCSFTGFDIYKEPTEARLVVTDSNSSHTYTRRIGEDCAVVRMNVDYHGVYDMISNYAELFAMIDQAESSNLNAMRWAKIYRASTKAEAESIKKATDEILSGKPACFIGDENPAANGEWFNDSLRSSYLLDMLTADRAAIKNRFNTDFGIPNTNAEKKERLIVDEVNANNIETFCKADLWIESINNGLTLANDMFGLDMSVERRWADV